MIEFTAINRKPSFIDDHRLVVWKRYEDSRKQKHFDKIVFTGQRPPEHLQPFLWMQTEIESDLGGLVGLCIETGFGNTIVVMNFTNA